MVNRDARSVVGSLVFFMLGKRGGESRQEPRFFPLLLSSSQWMFLFTQTVSGRGIVASFPLSPRQLMLYHYRLVLDVLVHDRKGKRM